MYLGPIVLQIVMVAWTVLPFVVLIVVSSIVVVVVVAAAAVTVTVTVPLISIQKASSHPVTLPPHRLILHSPSSLPKHPLNPDRPLSPSDPTEFALFPCFLARSSLSFLFDQVAETPLDFVTSLEAAQSHELGNILQRFSVQRHSNRQSIAH